MNRFASLAARAAAFSAVVVGAPLGSALAHPGHGSTGDGHTLAHYLGEPLHVAGGAALLLGVVAVAAALRVRRRAPESRRDS